MVEPFNNIWRQVSDNALVGFGLFAFRRFMADDCPRTAASLSYSTLLSLIPFLAVILAALSFMPRFEGLYDDIQDAIVANFLPEAGQEVEMQMTVFVENAQAISGVGFVVLIVIIHLLMSNVIAAFNRIWRVVEPRALFMRFSLQWIVVLVGPILLGVSITISSYAFAMVEWAGLDSYAQSFYFARLLPFLTAVTAFGCLYILLPAREVRIRDALMGALFAGVLFEFLKRGFGIYLRQFPSYEVIYGALAAIPVFLIWTYLLWVVILLGAELTAALPEWRVGRRTAGGEKGPALRIALAVSILQRLWENRDGRLGIRETTLLRELPAEPGYLSDVLARMRRAGLIRRRRRRWVMTRDVAGLTLADLVDAIGLSWEEIDNWPSQARRAVDAWVRDPEGARRLSLTQLFGDPGEPQG